MQDISDQLIEESAEAQPAVSLLIRRFLTALRRKWWLVAICALLPVGPAWWYTQNQPVQYVSEASMWVRGKLRLTDVGQYVEDSANFFGNQIQLLKSDRMRELTLRRLEATRPGLAIPRDANGNPALPKVRISHASDTSFLILESYSLSKEYAQAYLNALMDAFLAYKREIRAATSGDVWSSVSAQVSKQELELRAEQEKLAQFQRENNVAVLEEELRGGGTQLAQLNSQLGMLRLELQLLDAVELEADAGLRAGTNSLSWEGALNRFPGAAAALATPPPDYIPAKHRLQELKLQRERFARFMRPNHPKMVKLDEEISRAEKLIELYQVQSRAQLTATKEALKLRIRSMEAAASELGKRVAEANRLSSELERIRFGIQRQQSFYDRLLDLLRGVDLNSSMSQEEVAILERAKEARLDSQSVIPMLAGSVVAGLGLGLGILFLMVYFDDRCETIPELRAHFVEGIFGQLPEVGPKQSNGALPILQADDSRHLFAESCRNLRSSLLFYPLQGERPKVVLVTSAAPDEGKSTVAVNLACSLASAGTRVLLVDCDLRRGHLHEILGVTNDVGLAECVNRSNKLEGVAVCTEQPGLFVLPRGKITTRSGELFLSQGFGALLDQARMEYDYVILDSIPVFAADDTTTLAPRADGVLFVVRRGFTSRALAKEALALLYQRQAKVLGIVFNRADARSGSYRYYKYSEYFATN